MNWNEKYGGKEVKLDKDAYEFLKTIVSLDKMAAPYTDKLVFNLHYRFLEKATVRHDRSLDKPVAGKSSVRHYSDPTEEAFFRKESAYEWANGVFKKRIKPILAIRSFVNSLPGLLFPSDSTRDTCMRSLYSSAVACCISLPEAFMCLENDEVDALDMFACRNKVCDKIRTQIIKNEVTLTFPKLSADDIECLKDVCTGETKYTKTRIEKALIANKHTSTKNADMYIGEHNKANINIDVYRGECWEAYSYFKKIPENARNWKAIEESVDLSRHFKSERQLEYVPYGYYFMAV